VTQSDEPSAARRWKLVNERLREQAMDATLEEKLEQLASLMASVDEFGWRKQLEEGDDRVRDLWVRLRAAHHRG
jgi:hypothetical protein